MLKSRLLLKRQQTFTGYEDVGHHPLIYLHESASPLQVVALEFALGSHMKGCPSRDDTSSTLHSGYSMRE